MKFFVVWGSCFPAALGGYIVVFVFSSMVSYYSVHTELENPCEKNQLNDFMKTINNMFLALVFHI